jgi:8-oxo-dGTP pyrophosphatase MutT (NUDIX family)
MRKAKTKAPRLRPTKEVSVMAWIEDLVDAVLLVRQAAGLKFWTLPGGKVKRGESLVKALKKGSSRGDWVAYSGWFSFGGS